MYYDSDRLDAFKMQLIRDILAINNLEMLDDVKKYVRQLTKIHQSQCSSEFMLNIPATVEELKESVERGLAILKPDDGLQAKMFFVSWRKNIYSVCELCGPMRRGNFWIIFSKSVKIDLAKRMSKNF